MNVTGYCTECHRVKTVNVSGSGMANLARGGAAMGICSGCRQKEDDLRRSEPMSTPGFPSSTALPDHVEMWHERELAPGTSARQVRDMHIQMHQQDPHGQQYGHKHVGPHDNVLRTRGR